MSDSQSSKCNCKWLKIASLVMAGIFGILSLIVFIGAIMLSLDYELGDSFKGTLEWLIFSSEITKGRLWTFGVVHLLVGAGFGCGYVYLCKKSSE